MRTIPAGLQTSLNGNAAALCMLITITRTDGVIVRLTDSDSDLAYGGDLYLANASVEQSNLEHKADLSADNAETTALIDADAIDGEDLRVGRYDYAQIEVAVVDRDFLAGGDVVLFRGRLGEVRLTRGLFTAELRGVANRLRKRLVENYSPTCRADLGDERCRVPVIPPLVQRSTSYAVGDYVRQVVAPSFADSRRFGDRMYRVLIAGTTLGTAVTYPTLVGSVFSDGSVTLLAEFSLSRAYQVASVIDGRSFTVTGVTVIPDAFFTLGHVQWEISDNAGIVHDVKSFSLVSTTGTWVLYDKTPYPIQVGDRLLAAPGCDKTEATCRAKFGNIINFRGEPYVPTADYLLQYPRRGGA